MQKLKAVFAIIVLALSTFLLMSNTPQNKKDYNQLWQKVDSLEGLRQPNAAMQVVDQIYEQAKADDNLPQLIKSQIYRIKLSSEFEEDYMVNAINKLQADIKTAEEPQKQILHSILGEMYMKYYQRNRYKILNLSTTINLDNDDIQSWDAAKLRDEAARHFQLSLDNPRELQTINIQVFDVILEEEKNSEAVRPTLFDFLAWRAIDFYTNDEYDVKVAGLQLVPDSKKYFDVASGFVKLSFDDKFKNSNTANALQQMQAVIQFHLNDKNPQALIDADLKRLEFLHNKAVLPDKDSIYLVALEQMKEDYKFAEASTSISFSLAQFHHRQAGKYQPLVSDDYRWESQKAKAICEEAIEAFPKSTGAHNCKIILTQILDKTITIRTENAVIPGQPSLGLLHWRNYEKLYFRLVKVDYNEYLEMSQKQSRRDIAEALARLDFVEAWSLDLPNENDYQTHSTEFQIPELPEGHYVLLTSDDEKFKSKNNKLAWTDFWATNLSYISQRLSEGGYDIFVLDRQSGKPVKAVKVNAYKRNYDYRQRSYNSELVWTKESDADGFVQIIPDNNVRGGITLELIDGADQFIPDDNFYLNKTRETSDKTALKSFIFTDRAIYRPGQLVYFKTIVLEKTGDSYEVKANASTKVEFLDANSQLISSVDLSTNDYGSANASFTIPQGLLNGQMRIKSESGSTTIQVEEYKRPKFEVIFEPLAGVYKLGETIEVSGKAQAYAGNMLDGAQVKYHIVRDQFFPWPRYGYGGYYPGTNPVEIATGTTTTDADGKFTISFEAIPDNTNSFGEKRNFSYTISADVTDINGETQSNSQAVNVGDQALILDVSIPESVNLTSLGSHQIIARNLNGQKQETTVKVQVYELIQPRGLIKNRYWQQPDKYIIAKDDFIKNFPNRVYQDENDPKQWEKGKLVFEKSMNTAVDSVLDGRLFQSWDPGKYRIELNAVDAFGAEVSSEKVFTLFDPNAKRPPIETYHWFEVLKSKGEPGESAKFLIGSSAKNVQVLYEIQHQGQTIERRWIKLSNAQELIEIPIKENYRGNFSFQYSFVVDNRIYSGTQIIEVPFTNKKLDLAFETMRSELEPGGREKWTVTIRDANGDHLAAEMLASMYDASLDAFVPHQWNFNLYHSYNQIQAWNSRGDFSTSNTSEFDFDPTDYQNYIFQQYDRLNWFGLNGYHGRYAMDAVGGMKSRSEMQVSAVPEPGQVESSNIVENDVEEMIVVENAEVLQKSQESQKTAMQVRRNFNETAFFYPELKTNDSGNVVIEFTLPESFTRWKFMGMAYTPDLMTGWLQAEFTAAKKLMVVPNAPRFFRQGDTLWFSAKISNLSDKKLDGNASLEFFDALSMKEVSPEIISGEESQRFTVEANSGISVRWKLVIPEKYGVLTYRVKASAENITDGEEKSIPVLSNRTLVTESMPMAVGGHEAKEFDFEKLIQSGESQSLENYRLTLEFASNPSWYAVQALPVIAESKYNNAVSIFSAFFANSIAFHITNQNPEIKRVFENWQSESPESFLSKLEKNQDLKQVLLEQSPWLLDAQNEKERKQRIALLFDLNNMQNRLDNAIRLLEKFQKPGGGFVWMDEMRESRYVTQLIVQGLGKLDHLGVIDALDDTRVKRMMNNSVRYLDSRINDDYEELKKRTPESMDENHLSSHHIQYLYARSFFRAIMINPSHETAARYYENQAEKYWQKQNTYLQAMIALALHRNKNDRVPELILTSLRDRALHSEEMGMYWRSETGYYWYQAPIESQAMMIELFDEVAKDNKAVEDMKMYLLKQKQTNAWETSRASVEAVYALLARGTDLLASNELVNITIGSESIGKEDMGSIEAGTGYFKTTWDAAEIVPEMGKVIVEKTDDGIAWGALYWQYFEDFDKITRHETGLAVQKQLFVETDTEEGRKITPLEDLDTLQIGDKIRVRIEIQVDRDMEYVHLRDMRAAAFEPVNVLSGYQHSGGLGYYQSTKDASTDFFFEHLRKGTYVFEYPLIASQAGDFSNGITTLQCMYAPEFSSHSEGIRVRIQ